MRGTKESSARWLPMRQCSDSVVAKKGLRAAQARATAARQPKNAARFMLARQRGATACRPAWTHTLVVARRRQPRKVSSRTHKVSSRTNLRGQPQLPRIHEFYLLKIIANPTRYPPKDEGKGCHKAKIIPTGFPATLGKSGYYRSFPHPSLV